MTTLARPADPTAGARTTRPGLLRWVAIGTAAGLAWGVVARVWMRYISTAHEFSWSGTLMIVLTAVLAGAALGVMEGLRRRGVGARRLLLLPLALPMFAAGPAAPLVPMAVVGGLAVSARGGSLTRLAATVVAVSPAGLLHVPSISGVLDGQPYLRFLWYLVLAAVLAVGWSTVWLRRAAAYS